MRGLSITERFTFGQFFNKANYETHFDEICFDFEGDYSGKITRYYIDFDGDFRDNNDEYVSVENYWNYEVAYIDFSCGDRTLYVTLGKELKEKDF